MKKLCFVVSIFFVSYAQAQDIDVFLIGDAGEPKLPNDKNLEFFDQKLASGGPEDVLIFLGDNLYPKGLPDEEDPRRLEMEQKLNPQLDLIKKFKGKSYIIPGNHDWAQGRKQGWDHVRNMEKYVTQYLGDPNVFLPKNGCPGPLEIQVNEEVTLLIVDTQYFLHGQTKARDGEGCDAPGTSAALELLEDMVIRNADKHILIAGHHPLYSYGPHGGKYKFWKTNLFPLTEAKSMRNLYIPLPGLGTIYWFARAVVGNIQDIPNPKYKAIRNVLLDIMSKAEDVVWVNGHEHSLQYIKREQGHFVTSGSGSKTSHVVAGKGTLFHKKARGFATLNYKKDGEVNLALFDGDNQATLYESTLYKKDVVTDKEAMENRPDFQGTSKTLAASEQYDIGQGGKFWLGEGYRKTWATPITVPVFDITKEYGGLEIIKRGGGRQTLSLRMEAANGKQYVLRSVEKDPSQLLPKALRKSFAADFLQDQISRSHPYAALTVPKIADAAGVYHANPKLVYVPSDPAFGKYRYAFADQMFLYEERPNDESAEEKFFGEGDDVKGTLDMLDREIYDDNDNWVDQKFVLKSRLFDMLIGDWDRHDDQWRWVGKKIEGRKGRRYRPIPRDRDQAYFTSDNFLPRLASSKWAVPSSEGFNPDIRWAPGFNWNMRWFDRTFLTEMEWSDWMDQINYLQSNVTDAVIDEAIKDFPEEVYEYTADEIASNMKSRRDKMPRYARELYEYLSKEVEVVGSNKSERFLVERLNDGQTRVTVNKLTKEGNLAHVMFERTFNHDETREIRLYGLGGQDVFDVEGEVNKGIRVRIIGGKKKDVISDRSNVQTGRKKTIVYDKKDKTVVNGGKETKLRLSDDPAVNLYNRKSYVYDMFIPLISAQFNPDNGLYLGGGFFFTDYSWRKDPYKSQHLFLVNGALGINSYNFAYTGKFTDVFGKWGVTIEGEQQVPFFVSNFFGLGNDSFYDFEGDVTGFDDDQIDFYRVETDRSLFRLNLHRNIGNKTTFKIGATNRLAQVSDVDDNRFLNEPNSGVDVDKIANEHVYIGLNTGISVDTRDHKGMPSSGILFNTDIEHLWGANSFSEDITRLSSNFSFYLGIKYPARLVIANRVGVEHLFNDDFEFFNASILGGWTNLRGFRRTRFYGQTAFYHNLDLRLKLFSFTTYIFPGQFGLLAFQDVGRVWIDGENSDTWHVGRGVGAYVSPLNALAISFEKNFTDEEDLFVVRFGFFF